MRRAALYAWNRGSLVIVDDGEPPAIVNAVDFDAARVDPYALARVVVAHDVARLLVVSATPEAGQRPFPEAAAGLAGELLLLCGGEGVEVVEVAESRRKAHRGAAAKLCPRGCGTEAARDALAMVLADREPAAAPRILEGHPDDSVAERAGQLRALHRGEVDEVVVKYPPTPGFSSKLGGGVNWDSLGWVAPGTIPAGPRVAGVDPGERWIAVAIGAETGVAAAPLAYVASLQVEIERTGKEQPTDEQLDAAVGKAVDFCELHGVERAAVERAVNVHRAPGKSAEEGAGLAAYLLRGQYVAGMLRGALRAAGREGGGALIPGKVESVSSVKGRNHVRKLAGQGIGKDSPWQPAARAAFGGTIPPGVGEHVLDAAVAAVWAVRPEEVPTAPRVAREPGKPRVGGHGGRAAKRAAERLAAGCRCPGSRCTEPECPLLLAANEKRREKMQGNANARRG